MSVSIVVFLVIRVVIVLIEDVFRIVSFALFVFKMSITALTVEKDHGIPRRKKLCVCSVDKRDIQCVQKCVGSLV